MKLPYGYVLIEGEIAVHEERENVVCSIFDAYLAGARKSLICSSQKASSLRQEKQNGPGRPWINF